MPAKQKILWANHKGGVGKSVLAFHTACAIAQMNPNVWLSTSLDRFLLPCSAEVFYALMVHLFILTGYFGPHRRSMCWSWTSRSLAMSASFFSAELLQLI
jgi:Mrp family chromosome partitioning ATPase